MTSNQPADSRPQLPTDTADAGAPTVAATREALDLDFETALAALREGIDGYGDRISASAAVLRSIDNLTVPTDLLCRIAIRGLISAFSLAMSLSRNPHTAV